MDTRLKRILESSDLGYIFFQLEGQKTLYYNVLASKVFGNSKGIVDGKLMFQDVDPKFFQLSYLEETLGEDEYTYFYDILVKGKGGVGKLCDLKLGFLDEAHGEVYLELRMKEGDRLQIAKQYVDASHKPEFILNFDEKLSVYHGNQHFYEIFGGNQEDFALTYDNHLSHTFTYNKQKEVLEHIHHALSERNDYHEDVEILTPTGETKWFYLDLQRKTLDDSGEKLICFMVCVDNRVEIENKLKTVSEYFNATKELSENLLFFIDLSTRTLYRNEAIASNYQLPAVVENFPEAVPESKVVHPDDLDEYMSFCRALMEGVEGVLVSRMRVPSGGYEHFRLTCKLLRDHHGRPKEILGKSENIENVLAIEERAYFDVLTKTYNKMTFGEKVSDLLSYTSDSLKHALVFMCVDNFKDINESLGHGFGDFLLESVGKRLKQSVREHDLMGRVGGDEFGILLHAVSDQGQLLERIHVLVQSLCEEYANESGRTAIGVSVGVAMYPEHGRTYEDLFVRSEKALHFSMKEGNNAVRLYDLALEGKKLLGTV